MVQAEYIIVIQQFSTVLQKCAALKIKQRWIMTDLNVM